MLIKSGTRNRIIEIFKNSCRNTLDGTPARYNKNECRRFLVILRFVIRATLDDYNRWEETARRCEREQKLLEEKGLIILWLRLEIKKANAEWRKADEKLANLGETLMWALDAWEAAGATINELFNLCGSHRVSGCKEAGFDAKSQSFSGLMFVYNLDYPDDGGDWIETTVDAPFTHAMKAYMLRELHTPNGQIAARKALEHVFPELMENAMYKDQDD